jgi:hypothetical protein
LSESFFNAFTSGAAVHIATSQLPALLGISVKRFGGAFKIIYTYKEIISNISKSMNSGMSSQFNAVEFAVILREKVALKFSACRSTTLAVTIQITALVPIDT